MISLHLLNPTLPIFTRDGQCHDHHAVSRGLIFLHFYSCRRDGQRHDFNAVGQSFWHIRFRAPGIFFFGISPFHLPSGRGKHFSACVSSSPCSCGRDAKKVRRRAFFFSGARRHLMFVVAVLFCSSPSSERERERETDPPLPLHTHTLSLAHTQREREREREIERERVY